MSVTLQEVLQTAVPPGVYPTRARQRPATIRQRVEAQGWRYGYLDGRTITDKGSFLQDIGQAMAFPAYFGHNWDALEECLNDLSTTGAAGYVVLYDHVSCFAENNADDWATALEIFADATKRLQADGTTLYLLLRGVKA